MSYCRWSSDNWRCDLYCYGGDGGHVTHVAGNRVVGDIPQEPSLAALVDGSLSDADFTKQHKVVMDFLQNAKRKPIGLPYDGQTFVDATDEEFHDRLLMLRAAGYHFPDYLLTDWNGEEE